MQNLLEDLKHTLQSDDRLTIDGKLVKNKIVELALAMDGSLIALLLSNEAIKKHFFKDISGVLVFDKVAFQSFISNKQFLPDSYTSFKNKIGLTTNGEYLTESNEVVLAWPYKDCVLEAGQTKEDQKRKEIFWNKTLAPDEIDRLLAPKALTNFKKYDKDGEHKVESISLDDNLIIKGNNLLALHSLKKQYAGKIKLIYIDPPYGTESDSFKYNDSFKRTTILTFLRNRIEIAKELLSQDGFIVIQGSFHHFPYIKVMCDEVIGNTNWRTTFNILVRHPDRTLTGDKEFNDVVEYAAVYSMNSSQRLPFIEEEKVADEYVLDVSLDPLTPDEVVSFAGKEVEVYYPASYSIIKGSPATQKLKSISIRGSLREKNSSGRFYVKHLEPLKESYDPLTLFKVPNMGDDAFGHRFFHLPKTGNKNGTYFQGMPQSSSVTKKPIPNFLDFVEEYNIVNSEGGVLFRNGKKPEELIKFFIEKLSNQGDIVLDFFAGSGTTASTAHKLGRKFITIEQMDYVHDITCGRLNNVIAGETGGISDDVNWHGGGSFTYCELIQHNANIIDKIEQANTTETLRSIWQEIEKTDFISYKIKPESINENIHEFESLSLEEQKQFLITVLDKNQLYVNYSDIEDEDYQVSDDDINLNKQFYGGV